MSAVLPKRAHKRPKMWLDKDQGVPETCRELFDSLPELPGFRAEVIEGSVVLTPVGTPEHANHAMLLYRALIPVMDEHGWWGYTGNVDVCLDGSREPVEPDFVLAPSDCPRWGERELRSSGLIMVAEVVSKGSIVRDRTEKPRLYAAAGVPIYLLIDIVATPQTVTVHSAIDNGAYIAVATVPIGSTVRLPDPIGLELDTSIFKG
ncbi:MULTISPECIES: Uma2 family endonuclease [unclassified Nonomuraea]|uniref:Uma2 family endonuclease n=1 Tax=unclassified Nonomuraea TaxID=2593643 RepID=UPI0033F39639